MKISLVGLNSSFTHTNLALKYIKAYCSNFDIYIDEYTINDAIENVIKGIALSKPDVVGFSCYIWNIEMVLKISGSLKKILPDTLILLGGPEVSFDSIELMKKNSSIDYIIKGEGETAALQLFSFLEGSISDIKSVGNLVYRHEHGIMENDENELIEDLDTIPFPYTDCECDFKNRIVYYESSRGCPYNCSYCLSSTIKGVRFFSASRVMRDLKWFIDHDIKLVKFVDRTFNCGKIYKDILRFLIENKKSTRFHFEISASVLDDEAIDILRSAPEGLFQLEIGVQSTNRHTLNSIKRMDDLKKLSENVLRIRENRNIPLHLDLICGLPGEGYESFSQSFNDVYNLKPDMLQLGFLKLLKGSSLREKADEFGISYADYPPYEVLSTGEISFEEISRLKGVESVTDRYYNSGRFEAIIDYLNMKYESPFMLFEDLWKFIYSSIKQGNLGGIEQYRILQDFCIQNHIGDKDIINACLLFDFLNQGRNPYIPDFLKNNGEIQRQKLWDFLSDADNINKYLPSYIGKNPKEIIKNIIIIKFSFDILNFIKNKEINNIETWICFDYSSKISGSKYAFSLNKL